MPTTTGTATDLITFSRGSLATVTDSNGKIKWALHNLLLASEQFDASNWEKTGATVTANTTAAPNGTTTADTLAETATTNYHLVTQSATSAGSKMTFTVYAKAASRSAFYLRFYTNVNDYEIAVFNLTNGTNSQNASGSSTSFTQRTQSIEDVGNGWYRCSITAVYPSSGVSNMINIADNPSGITFDIYGGYSYAGVAGYGIYLWGAHLYRSDLGGMQANASAYPYYNPSTPKNLLGYSEAFSNAAWQLLADGGGGAPTKGTVTGTFPTGSAGTVNTITFPVVTSAQTSAIYQTLGAAYLNTPITFSVYARVSSGTRTIYLNVEDNAAAPAGGNFFASAAKTLTTEWQRISVTGTRTSNTGNVSLVIGFDTRCSAGQTNASSVTVELWGAQLSDSASLDPYVGSYGAAPSPAAAYGPRLDYDPSTLAAKGLLVEEQRTNLFLQSTFSSSWLTTGGAVLTPNNIVAPDGSITGAKIDLSTTVNSAIYQVVATVGTFTQSVWLRGAVGGETVQLSFFTPSPLASGASAVFTLTTSWQRYTFTTTCSASTFWYIISNNTTAKTIYAWGAQIEAGAFATSYIPTAAATVTRNADVASVATSQFPYSATEGTLVAKVDCNTGIDIASYFVHLGGPAAGSNYGSSNGIFRGGTASSLAAGQRVKGLTFNDSNVLTGDCITSGDINTAIISAAYGYAANDFGLSVNGAAAITDTSGALPSAATTLSLGTVRDGVVLFLNGHIRQITYIPRRLTNAELQARTA